MNKIFVFDLDDTLIDNVHDYADPILDTCRLIIKTLGRKAPHVSKIIALGHEIDKRRRTEINPSTGQLYLWSIERFPTSLVELYREICKRSRVASDKGVEETLYNIGFRAFDEARYRENIHPDAWSVVEFLKHQGDTLLLCTKGDARVQWKKIAALRDVGINFALTRIVDQKTPEVFREIVGGFKGDSYFSVGNSYTADIQPALDAGFKGIYIPVETWETIDKMDLILSEVDTARCVVLADLGDLKTQYGRLQWKS